VGVDARDAGGEYPTSELKLVTLHREVGYGVVYYFLDMGYKVIN
jgi:hypothetical protein